MNMTAKLLGLLLDDLLTFELARPDAPGLDEDTACKRIEDIIGTLREMPAADIRVFLSLAAEKRAATTDPAAHAFLDMLPENFAEELAAA